MFRLLYIILLYVCLTQCEVTEKNAGEQAQMMGVDTVHNPKPIINKDTIITRNLKLEQRGKGKKSNSDDKLNEPTYSAIPESIREHVDEFKRNMSECLKEVQENDKRPVRRLSPKTESPVHGECLIACVLKRNGVIINNKVNKDNLIILVNKFFGKDTKLMKKLEKNLDQCIERSAHHRDECDLAVKINECTNDLMVTNKHQILVNY